MNPFARRLVPVGDHPLSERGAYRDLAERAREERSNGIESTTVDIFERYRPHRYQRMIHNARTRFVAAVAGRRGGKTVGIAAECLQRIFDDLAEAQAAGRVWTVPTRLEPDSEALLNYWCVAPTYKLTMLQRRELFRFLGDPDRSPLVLKYDRQNNTLWLVGGVKIEFRSADRQQMLVGDSLDGVWLDEAARFKRDAWSDNISANLSDRLGWALFSTTPLGRNWFFDEIWQRTQRGTDEETRDPDFFGVMWTTAQNDSLPHLVEEAARARLRLPRAVYLRNYEASFDAFEGQIFGMFDAALHVVDRVPWSTLVKRWGGVDWGSSNPGCQLEFGLDDKGVVWVFREDYETDLVVPAPSGSPDEDCWVRRFKRAKRMRKLTHWWSDPAGRGNMLTCRREGLNFRPARNEVQAGIEAVAAALAPALDERGNIRVGLKIHKSCVNLLRELPSYRWGAKGDKPVKENDHAVDALRYGLYSEALLGEGAKIRALQWSIFEE